jgi:tyrosyl-tRNA synthetase
MDTESKVQTVREIAQEIITEEELRHLFQTKNHPVAYNGFEPSGLSPIHFGVYTPIIIRRLVRAGVAFKIYIADWFAWINNKMGGDLDNIKKVGEYFIEVWKAAGIPVGKGVRFVWASDLIRQDGYWSDVIKIAKRTTLKRAQRCLTIMGRKEGELNDVAQLFYPMMQATDIFHLGVDITQLGVDQRKVNMLAREVAEKVGYKKPVAVHHPLIMGLEGPKKGEGFDENKDMDVSISSKMSKSNVKGSIFVHDSEKEIYRKMGSAYCPAKVVENNPVLNYMDKIIFKQYKEVRVERPEKYGGDVYYVNYNALEKDFVGGNIHPLDLKNAVAFYLGEMIEPIRSHFEKGRAKRLYEEVKRMETTR